MASSSSFSLLRKENKWSPSSARRRGGACAATVPVSCRSQGRKVPDTRPRTHSVAPLCFGRTTAEPEASSGPVVLPRLANQMSGNVCLMGRVCL